MKIYTRTGDDGTTSLFAGGRISKGHVRIHAYGSVDELNTVLGLALAADVDVALRDSIQRVQGELFTVGADLAAPLDANTQSGLRVDSDMIDRLESEIDAWQAELPGLKHFVLPGGSLVGAFLHQARVICRRAERWVVMLQEDEPVNRLVMQYLNRLSDWLFVAARLANDRAGHSETVWESPRKR